MSGSVDNRNTDSDDVTRRTTDTHTDGVLHLNVLLYYNNNDDDDNDDDGGDDDDDNKDNDDDTDIDNIESNKNFLSAVSLNGYFVA